MSRMYHIGMSKQQQATDTKRIAMTNTHNQAATKVMMMIVFREIKRVLFSLVTVLEADINTN